MLLSQIFFFIAISFAVCTFHNYCLFTISLSQWTNNFDWSQKKTQKKICFLWGWIWFLFFSFSHQIAKKYNKIAGSIWKRKGTRLHTRNIKHKCYQDQHLAFIISFPLQSLKGLFWFLKSPLKLALSNGTARWKF